MTRREKKPRPPCVSKLHPGTADVAAAMGWSVEVTRVVAGMAGCPTVRGGRGRRFVSVDALKAWFEALPIERRLVVPEVDLGERMRLAAEVAGLTWAGQAEQGRLARAHDYAALVRLRDDLGERMRVAAEVAELTWAGQAEQGRLARAHDYAALVRLRDEWHARDQTDRGRLAAKSALARKP